MIAIIAEAVATGPDWGAIGTGVAIVLSAAAALYTAIGQRKTVKGDQSLARLEALTDNLQEDNRVVRERCDRCESRVEELTDELRAEKAANRRLRDVLRRHGIPTDDNPTNGDPR